MKIRSYVIIIPARFNSTRLPGKPLIKLKGLTILERTYNQCIKALPKKNVFVATDSELIKNFCIKNSINFIMTSKRCLTGTDRVAEAAKKIQAKYYVNIQGDEPFFPKIDIKKLIQTSKKYPQSVINGFTQIKQKKLYFSPHIPKVVFNDNEDLLYMSRSPIPGNKKKIYTKAWRQVCGYVFPNKKLMEFCKYKRKKKLESVEDIEILRFIEMGINVKMVKLSNISMSIDTKQDLALAKKKIG